MPNFGQGFYTATDISNILNLNYSKVSYWFRKYVKGEFESSLNYRYYYDVEEITAVNFYTLIEIYVFDFFRQNKISTNRIVLAHKVLSELLNTPYPFCHSDMLLISGKDILIQLGNLLAVSEPGFQQTIKDYVLPYAHKIEFLNKIADKYYPLGKQHSIVVNPKNQFGSPIIDGTNIKVSTLTSLYRGGEEIGFISNLYNLSEQQVRDALIFDKAA